MKSRVNTQSTVESEPVFFYRYYTYSDTISINYLYSGFMLDYFKSVAKRTEVPPPAEENAAPSRALVLTVFFVDLIFCSPLLFAAPPSFLQPS